MVKKTVKDVRKEIRAMMDKHKKPPEMNPIDTLMETAKKMNKGVM